MTTPQKVTKRRLVAYIEPKAYDYLEQFSLSHDCSISKSAEKMILQSMRGIPEGPIQQQIKSDTIDITIWEFLSHLPEEIIGKMTEQIMTSPFFYDQIQMIHAGPDHASTVFPGDDDESVNQSNFQIQKNYPDANIDKNVKEDVLILAHPETVRHSSHQNFLDAGMEDTNKEVIQLPPSCPSGTSTNDQREIICQNTSDSNRLEQIGSEFGSKLDLKVDENNHILDNISENKERKEIKNEFISGETQTQRVALLLKKFLEDNNISQRTFKQKYGIDITPIKSWLLGTRFISDKMALKIVKIITV